MFANSLSQENISDKKDKDVASDHGDIHIKDVRELRACEGVEHEIDTGATNPICKVP